MALRKSSPDLETLSYVSDGGTQRAGEGRRSGGGENRFSSWGRTEGGACPASPARTSYSLRHSTSALSPAHMVPLLQAGELRHAQPWHGLRGGPVQAARVPVLAPSLVGKTALALGTLTVHPHQGFPRGARESCPWLWGQGAQLASQRQKPLRDLNPSRLKTKTSSKEALARELSSLGFRSRQGTYKNQPMNA